jgi:DNA-binding NtrC family response regulator
MKKILIVDDEVNSLKVLAATLNRDSFETATARSGAEAIEKFDTDSYDLVLTDYMMPEMNGEELLKELRSRNPSIPVILLTGHGSIELAVNAMQHGAFSYLTKPVNLDAMLSVVQEALRSTSGDPTVGDEQEFQFLNIFGNSKAIAEVFQMIRRISKTDANILILGESGTGKELIARAIHYYSMKCGGPFIPLDCTTIPSELIENELFGHEKGAFTCAYEDKKGLIEMANNGTIFMDEIGDLDYSLQKKLLRFLQEREFFRVGGKEKVHVETRVLAATNMNLEDAVDKGTFRSDLYYRLNVISISVPPLRERIEDIPILVSHFIDLFNKKNNKNILGIEDSVMELFMGYDWPGNVRELENTIERAVILCSYDHINNDCLPHRLKKTSAAIQNHDQFNLHEIEKRVITKALDANGWNQSRSADLLGISRKQLRTKMKNLNLLQDVSE